MQTDTEQRMAAVFLVAAGVCFLFYPAIRPFADEDSLAGAGGSFRLARPDFLAGNRAVPVTGVSCYKWMASSDLTQKSKNGK
jgi:hypothetical protein